MRRRRTSESRRRGIPGVLTATLTAAAAVVGVASIGRAAPPADQAGEARRHLAELIESPPTDDVRCPLGLAGDVAAAANGAGVMVAVDPWTVTIGDDELLETNVGESVAVVRCASDSPAAGEAAVAVMAVDLRAPGRRPISFEQLATRFGVGGTARVEPVGLGGELTGRCVGADGTNTCTVWWQRDGFAVGLVLTGSDTVVNQASSPVALRGLVPGVIATLADGLPPLPTTTTTPVPSSISATTASEPPAAPGPTQSSTPTASSGLVPSSQASSTMAPGSTVAETTTEPPAREVPVTTPGSSAPETSAAGSPTTSPTPDETSIPTDTTSPLETTSDVTTTTEIATTAPAPTESLWTLIQSDPELERFTEAVNALSAVDTDVVDLLNGVNGLDGVDQAPRLTILAPTDAVVEAADPGAWQALLASPDALRWWLLGHVVEDDPLHLGPAPTNTTDAVTVPSEPYEIVALNGEPLLVDPGAATVGGASVGAPELTGTNGLLRALTADPIALTPLGGVTAAAPAPVPVPSPAPVSTPVSPSTTG